MFEKIFCYFNNICKFVGNNKENIMAQKGGKRQNSGRKEVSEEEKKVPLTFYVKKKNKEDLRQMIQRTIKNLDR